MTWWSWMLVLALPVGYLRLVAHELSHAAMTIALGGKVYWREFRPWPHKADGRWRWGRMFREDLPGDDDDLLIGLAPLGRATVGALLWIPFAVLWIPLWVCVFWELTDIIHWWVGWFRDETSDGGKVRAVLRAKRTAREQVRKWPKPIPVGEIKLEIEPHDPMNVAKVKITGASLVKEDDVRSLNKALVAGYDAGEDITDGLVPQDCDLEKMMREAATYDAEKLKAHRELWDSLPGAEVEDEE